MKKKVSVVGAGAWGTAFACVLADNGHEVMLWTHEADVIHAIKNTRINSRYLPGVVLSERITPTDDLENALCDSEYIFEAIPIKFLRTITSQAAACYNPKQKWVILSKGIEIDSLSLPGSILETILDKKISYAVFSGPTFAHDVARKQPSAGVIAGTDEAILADLEYLLNNDYFRAVQSSDALGVQVGGALKNVIALAVGILDGAGFTDNAKALIITQGLAEMAEINRVFGGQTHTLYGLSGVGDLVLTALSKKSRNMSLGYEIGKGKFLAECAQQASGVAEGVNTVQAVYQLIQKNNLSLPICSGVYEIIFEKKTVASFIKDVLQAV